MKLRLLTAATAALAFAAPAAASAAELTVEPQKSCYGHGEAVKLTGTGFSPNAEVAITRDGQPLGEDSSAFTDASGTFSGTLRLRESSGKRTSTYVATDTIVPTLTASTQLTVSAVNVTMGPANGPPHRLLTIKASGFTLGKTLWAHVRKGQFKRNVKIGSLKRACHVLRAKQRLLPRGAETGTYKIQFDTFRKFKARRAQFVRYELRVFRTFGFGIASASSRLF
jgi:hypothetical protein